MHLLKNPSTGGDTQSANMYLAYETLPSDVKGRIEGPLRTLREPLKMDFQYHHKWHGHDVVMWDNHCLLQRAGGGYEYPDIRLLHKTVVAGDKPY